VSVRVDSRVVAGVVAAGFAAVIAIAIVACTPRPFVVTQPAHIAVERSGSSETPHPAVAWDTSFWHATTTLNFPVAWAVASTREERQLIDGLQLMFDGRLGDADSTIQPLLLAEDTLVRHAARVAYDVLLSSTAEWQRLARFATSSPEVLRDAAGVEAWAPAFSAVRSRIEFDDTVSTLPLLRASTGVPVVTIRVNGILKRFWIDTGSSITILSAPVAAECGVVPVTSDTLESLTSVGRMAARPAVVASIQLGGVALTDIPAMIVDSTALTLRPGNGLGAAAASLNIDGILGFDVIQRLDLTIDDIREQVVVRRPVAQSGRGQQPRNLLWFGLPIVKVLSERGVPIYLSLDTGAEETYGTGTLITKTKTRAVQAERRMVNGFGKSTREQGVIVPKLRLFLGRTPLLFQRLFLYSAQYPTIFELDGTLGADVGRGGVVRIDMTNGRFEIGPS
jgi:hypothetical protein